MPLDDLGVLLPLTLEWALTEACNLRCAYCGARKLDRHVEIDFSKTLDRVVTLAPKHVWLGGGEPTLVRQLPAIARRLREDINPHLCLNTNMTRLEPVLETLPYLDDLVISFDTLDSALSRKYRGIDAEEMMEKIRLVSGVIREKGLAARIVVNSVVVRESLDGGGLAALSNALAEIDGSIGHTLSAVFPREAPESIIGDAAYTEKLFGMVDALKAKGRRVSVQLASNLARHALNSEDDPFTARDSKCYRRYFRLWLTGNGEFHSNCPPASPRSAVCDSFCNCAEFVDNLLFLKPGQEADEPFFNGKFTPFDVALLRAFVRQYINPGLHRDAYRKLLKQ